MEHRWSWTLRTKWSYWCSWFYCIKHWRHSPGGLTFVERFLYEFEVTVVFTNACFIQMAHSINPRLEGFLLLCLTKFNMILQFVIEVSIKLIMKGGIIKKGGGIPQQAVQFDDIL